MNLEDIVWYEQITYGGRPLWMATWLGTGLKLGFRVFETPEELFLWAETLGKRAIYTDKLSIDWKSTETGLKRPWELSGNAKR